MSREPWFAALTQAVREADRSFESGETGGGGTRHWLRDCFLPILEAHGLRIADIANETCPACGHEWRRHDPEDGECDAHSGEDGVFGPCRCGRDIAFTTKRNAELSAIALEASADRRIANNQPRSDV